MRESHLGKQSAGDSPLPSGPHGGPAPPWGPVASVRLCLWITSDGDVVQWSVDAWDKSWELETIYVRPVGPFDDFSVGLAVSEALGLLAERGIQRELPL